MEYYPAVKRNKTVYIHMHNSPKHNTELFFKNNNAIYHLIPLI